MSVENASRANGHEWLPDQSIGGEFCIAFESIATTPEYAEDQSDAESRKLESLRRELADTLYTADDEPLQNSLYFPPYRFDDVRSYSSSADRRKHFIDNTVAIKSLSGDTNDTLSGNVQLPKRNPLIRLGAIVLDVIRYPINPIDNAVRVKESAKRFARKLPFTKNMKFLREIPEAEVTPSTKIDKTEHQLAISLSQMRREALPYDGDNPFIHWVVNRYAKKNINMTAAKALTWFALGNTPLIGFLISSGKLYLPNFLAPLYERKFQRAIKTLFLTGTDFIANVYQSARAFVMIQGGLELFTTQGLGRGLLALPGFLLSNWEILAAYPVILAYNPLFIQGRLDQNDYRKYTRHFEHMQELLWNGSTTQKLQVVHTVKDMLKDYGKNHPHNTSMQNAAQLSMLMQREYTALLGRLADEQHLIDAKRKKFAQLTKEHQAREEHKLNREIAELSLRNKSHRARLLYIENLHLLMQETGHIAPSSVS